MDPNSQIADTNAPLDQAATDLPAPVDWNAVLDGTDAEPSAADGLRQLDEAKQKAQQADSDNGDVTENPTADVDAEADLAAEGEQEQATEVEEEPEADPNVLQLDSLRSLFPEAVIESSEDVERVVTQYRERSDAFSQFEEIADQHPQVISFIKTLMDSGDPVKAALEAVEGLTLEAPDPELDPEKYADYKARKAEERVRKEYQQKELSAQEQRRQHGQKQLQRLFDEFVEQSEMSEEDAKRFGTEASVILMGDLSTGKRRADTFRVIRDGLNHRQVTTSIEQVTQAAEKGQFGQIKATESDPAVVASVKKAITNAFAAGVRSVQQKAKQPATPNLNENGSKEMPEFGEEAEAMRRFAKETIPQGDVLSTALESGLFVSN